MVDLSLDIIHDECFSRGIRADRVRQLLRAGESISGFLRSIEVCRDADSGFIVPGSTV